jgi:hypothetical protein
MRDPSNDDSSSPVSEDGAGVLANLPRTRPQRSSPRRAAARASAKAKTRAKGEEAAKSEAAPTTATGRPAGAGKRRSPGGAGAKAAGTAAAKGAKATAGAGKRAGAAKPRAARPARETPVVERAPRQGFESEGERGHGAVQPPGGAELVASAAEIFGELAKAGVSAGERVLKDVLGRLPL